MPHSALFEFSRVKNIWVKVSLWRGEKYAPFQTKSSLFDFSRVKNILAKVSLAGVNIQLFCSTLYLPGECENACFSKTHSSKENFEMIFFALLLALFAEVVIITLIKT